MLSKAQQPTEKSHFMTLGLLLSLYLAQGLPVGFMTQALPTLLRHYGVSLTQIGVSGLLMLPWAIKFLWAPYVDRFASRRLGHYRAWILLTQGLSIVCLVILAYLPVEQLNQISALWGLFVVLFVLNSFCATQDIATDGLAVKILNKGQLHWGNTFQVMGSRLGFILGGGLVLYAIDLLSWQVTFLALAGGVLLNSFPIIRYREAPLQTLLINEKRQSDLWQKLKSIYGYLWTNKELKLWLLVIFTYKIADGLSGPILKPMMVDMGLSLSQIGVYVTMFGACCALLGALLAGWLIQQFRLRQMFIVFAILQSMALAYYLILAYCFEQQINFPYWHLYLANALEEFFAAMSLVAMLSLIMSYARQKYAGSDFTLQVALMTTMSGILYLVSGRFADMWGYFIVLLFVFIISWLCLIPKLIWMSINKTHF